ncbi:ATP-binding protein [Pseudomonas syringae]|nr:AAA family ATPase [Pseudomonas syringae]
MRIDSIFIENFQGLRHASLELNTPITMVLGANGAGKSSLQEAIGLALGEAARVAHKKDYGQLVTEGQKKASIVIGHDGVASSFALPSGKAERQDIAGAEYLPFVLKPGAFAELDDKARRKVLFSLTKSGAKPALVVEKLLARKANPAKIDKIKPLLLSGMAAGQEQAKTYAAESRGAWKAITGEAYGSEKAESWVLRIPEGDLPTEAELATIMADHQKAAAEVEKGIKFLGELEGKRTAGDNHAARLATAEQLAGQLPRRQAKLDTTTKDLDAWAPKLLDLETRLAGMTSGAEGCDCPSCGTTLKIVGNKLELFQGLKADVKARTDLALEVTNAKKAVELLKRTQQNDMNAVAEAEAAVKSVAALKAEKVEGADEALIKRSEEALVGCRLKADQLRAKYNALYELKVQAEKAEETTGKAAGHHVDVLEWVLIEKALAPDGIPGEILAGALQPFNAALARLSTLAGWKQVQIDGAMTITAGGRMYRLLSESERWRVDTLLATAIALVSGLKLVVLDRFDVLDMPSRSQCIGMLMALAKKGELETGIVCGTLKEKPAKLPPEITAFWIEGSAGIGPKLQQAV